MSAEQYGDEGIDDLSRVCPEGRECVEGECPGRQVGTGVVGFAQVGNTIINLETEQVEWCGRDPIPDQVDGYQKLLQSRRSGG